MKKSISILAMVLFTLAIFAGCDNGFVNKTALDEQALTEVNQGGFLKVQPPPRITWSLERDNLIKRFKLMNDRSVMFYMYIFIEGVAEPVGYYQVNKVSSVNSQLTNTEQIVRFGNGTGHWSDNVLPSPAEDGSYGTNGDGVFGFTPEDIYIEHNMKYIVATVPLSFQKAVQRLTIINVETENQLRTMMNRINNAQVIDDKGGKGTVKPSAAPVGNFQK